ncbi:uncharacterized protein LOC131876121 [Cryptomeria japonica]|uniref:uncharacterized protein LOC131876121 n=1 Tax=Cryptomeria japonica TaxID=3369 RepID=UPI0027DA367A|nr:uncharacterized protein LOC131876121 [Cryptomeria japonica]
MVDNNYEKGDIWKNTPYNENRDQYIDGQCNNRNDEIRNNRGNYGKNGNYGNNGSHGNNGGNRNYQTNNYGCRLPLTMERKRQNLGDYLHEHIEAWDIFTNKESNEAMQIVQDPNQKLEEKRQRLQELGEEEEVESDSGENEVISRFRRSKREEEPEAQDEIVARVNTNIYVTSNEYTSFVSDDEFIKSKDFKSFLYQFKGKRVRE